ncbi:hypothetical protein DJ78_14600 [Halorubrum ezzemoulense]|uniref:Fibronectin type-III domain-containing protein n=1 Tax=Halorubrum ezzemoulense TaxID=337243 RepID=A0A256JHE1_HALEZ|nr:hypothetical protein DJ78_14600 [Halorubrum ezzemoulense]
MAVPINISVTAVRDDAADLEWTASHTAGETRIDVSEDNDGTWTPNTTVARDVESASVSGLLNGQLYGVRVVASTPDTDAVDTVRVIDVASGETLSIASGETFEFAKPHVNAGTVSNEGTMQPDDTQP